MIEKLNNGKIKHLFLSTKIKINVLDLLYAGIISLSILLICTFSDKNFFFYDDAQHNYLPYLRSAGKIWLNGEIPFMIKNTFISQNQVVDIDKAIFLPQNIFLSILAAKITSFTVVANIFAFINMFIMSFFALKIVSAFSLSKRIGIIIAFLFCMNPVFLYFYLPSWWNVPAGQAWFVGALASILLLRKNFSLRYLILNVFTVLSLLGAAWPQSIMAYFVVATFFVFELLKNKEYKKMYIFFSISFGIILIGLNIYSEYILSLNLLNRDSRFGNFGNLFTPSFNHIFMTFNPVYYNFLSRFQGYLLTYIPIGYSSIYILFLICFKKNFWDLFKDKNFKFLSYLVLVFAILSQLPSNFSQLRYNFRFLPYLSEILIIISLYGINKFELEFSKKRIQTFIGILILSSLLSFFALEDNFWKVFQVNIIFLILSVSYLYSFIKNKKMDFLSSIVYTIFMLLLMLFVQKSVDGVLPFPNIKKEINRENYFSKTGYLLSLTNGREGVKKNIEDLYSAQFLLYNIKAINGYSAIGNIKLEKSMDTYWSQHFFNEEKTIDKMSNRFNGVCYFDLFNIDSIVIYKEKLTEDMRNKIQSCGYSPREVKAKDILFFNKSVRNIGNISYVSNGIKINKMLEDRNNIEKYSITSTKSGIIILSKPYWRGYKAYVNNKKVNISEEGGLLKLDNIPQKLNNANLEIKYFPVSWKITLWLGLIGIIEIFLVLRCLKKWRIESN